MPVGGDLPSGCRSPVGCAVSDAVNHPSHYNKGMIEVIDAIEGMELGYHEGNIVKYVARWKYKNGVEDLKKARFYLERLIALQSEES